MRRATGGRFDQTDFENAQFFGDMSLIGRIYRPDVAVLPIGDHFTMGPREAAVAAELGALVWSLDKDFEIGQVIRKIEEKDRES